MIDSRTSVLLVGLIVVICLAQPAHAYGAGNIASSSPIEGTNWRHGDIEDVLLKLAVAKAMKGKTFDKTMVARVYFGNWLRDYSQAIDVGTVKSVSAEAIRLVLAVLSFFTFGYGSKEFEVTEDRLGCYRPEEHIDNPKNYADNQDARQYDRRLRGPIDERRELSVDPQTGMKNYIANESAGIMTSATMLRDLFGKCIELGRQHARRENKEALYEAMRLMGTGLHCLEDFFAHSNYTELALIEMGERDVFPHVGRRTAIRLEGARGEVYPVTTGTFGGVDFLHSVTGEVSDKLAQNELQELQHTLEDSKKNDTSGLKKLLDMIPDSFFGGKHQSDKLDEIQQNTANAQMQNLTVAPKEPTEFTKYCRNLFKQIIPIIEWHDEIMKVIKKALPSIPVLPKIVEKLEEELNKFIFAQIAPFVLPVINQIESEMKAGSEGIIKSSQNEQLIVFNDDHSTDPTHSMLSKDHFTNLLNEPSGRTASEMVKWVVPQLMNAIDDERVDINRTVTRIIYGVLHHPAQRGMGQDGIQDGRKIIFGSVEKWWKGMGRQQQDDYRRKLSREGVRKHENHKEGEYDTGHGHGCVGSLHMHSEFKDDKKKKDEGWEDKIADHAANAIWTGATGAISGVVKDSTGINIPKYGEEPEKKNKKEDGGNLLDAASSLIGGILGGGKDDKDDSKSSRRDDGRKSPQHRPDHGQSGHSQSQSHHSDSRPSHGGSGGRRDEGSSYGRQESSSGGYGSSQQSYGGSHQSGGHGGRRDDNSSSYGRQESSSGGYGGGRRDDNSSSYGRQESSSGGYGSSQQSSGYGSRRDDNSSSYGRQESSSGGYGGRRDDNSSSYGRQESSSGGYGSSQQSYGGSQQSGGYGSRRDDNSSSYGRQESSSGGYGGSQQSSGYGSRRDDNSSSYGRQESSGGGYGGRDNDNYGRSSGGRETSSGGYGGSSGGYGGSSQQSGGYGGSQQSSGYGGQHQSGGYGGQQSSGYGGQQSSGRQQGYGRDRDDDDDNNRRQGGSGGYSGSSGYGGSGGYGGGSSGRYDDNNSRRY